ncbi:hypothetical protein AB0I94_34795 [Streptomyces sp. NPDC050147]|uniref:hypothetical protein n=1 Tax=Streptomyces sp. NPDC050147 TaxID=3155513 RepID=UPI0034376787
MSRTPKTLRICSVVSSVRRGRCQGPCPPRWSAGTGSGPHPAEEERRDGVEGGVVAAALGQVLISAALGIGSIPKMSRQAGSDVHVPVA